MLKAQNIPFYHSNIYFLSKDEHESLESNTDLEEDSTETITWKHYSQTQVPAPKLR